MATDLDELLERQRASDRRWNVGRKIGEGGMGVVYEASRAATDLGIRSAVKIMRPELKGRPEHGARFLDEVRITARLDHPNIVRVTDIDHLVDGTPFIVMELLNGGTLSQVLRLLRRALPPPVALEIIEQACAGLNAAHSAGIVHRDIKPSNIYLHNWLATQPVIKLLDFGCAKLLGTADHAAFGTPRYMAPEQIRGEPVTSRADLYSIALVLCEIVTGRLPWLGLTDAARCREVHLCVAPTPPQEFASWLPKRANEIILAAIEKDPVNRPRDVNEFTAALADLHFCDGSDNPVDVNSTAPTIATIGAMMRDLGHEPDPREATDSASRDTADGMMPPPLDGPSIEVAPDDWAADLWAELAAPASRKGRSAPSGSVAPPTDRLAPERQRPMRDMRAGGEAPNPIGPPPRSSETATSRSVPLRAEDSGMRARRPALLLMAAASVLALTCAALVGSGRFLGGSSRGAPATTDSVPVRLVGPSAGASAPIGALPSSASSYDAQVSSGAFISSSAPEAEPLPSTPPPSVATRVVNGAPSTPTSSARRVQAPIVRSRPIVAGAFDDGRDLMSEGPPSTEPYKRSPRKPSPAPKRGEVPTDFKTTF